MTVNNRPPILVTGGTGTLGRHVVPRLLDAAHDVRILSRQARPRAEGIEYVTGDLATGDGVEAAVDGVELILHLAGSSKGDETKARHLTRAAARAGVGHLVFISVVGADRIPIESAVDRMMFGYFGAKLAAERTVAASGVPWTTLRADLGRLHCRECRFGRPTATGPGDARRGHIEIHGGSTLLMSCGSTALTRRRRPSLSSSFDHGMHHCIGAPLVCSHERVRARVIRCVGRVRTGLPGS